MTEIKVIVDSVKSGFKSNRTWATLTVNPIIPPDSSYNLNIEADDITLSQESIKDGDEIQIEVLVWNDGDGDAPAFTIRIMIDGIVYLDDSYTNLDAGNSQSVNIYWTATEGNHTIRVEIIPTQPALESDSTDNSAETQFEVLSKESDDDDDSSGSGKDASANTFMWILVIVIVVIVVIVVLVLLLKRKKPAEEYPHPPDYYPPQSVPPEPAVEQVVNQEQPSAYAQPSQPQPPPIAAPVQAPPVQAPPIQPPAYYETESELEE
jgi:hypothetical protein